MELFPCLAEVLELMGLAVADPKRFPLEKAATETHKKLLIVHAKMDFMVALLESITEYESLEGIETVPGELSCPREIAGRCSLNLFDSEFEDFQPSQKVSEDEVVLGELSDELKKLYLAIACLSVEVQELEDETDADSAEELKRKNKLKAVMENVLWYEITDDFNLWQHKGTVVCLRAGWKVVVFDDRRKNTLNVHKEQRGTTTATANPSTGVVFGIVFTGFRQSPN